MVETTTRPKCIQAPIADLNGLRENLENLA